MKAKASEPPNRRGVLFWIGIIGSIVTIIGGPVIYFTLCPAPSIERDITLDETNVFAAQFLVKNKSPYFDMYSVQPSCFYLDYSTDMVAGPRDVMSIKDIGFEWPLDRQERVFADTSFTMTCKDDVGKPRSTIHLAKADIVLQVRYHWWFWPFTESTKMQRVVMSRDVQDKPVWLFRSL